MVSIVFYRSYVISVHIAQKLVRILLNYWHRCDRFNNAILYIISPYLWGGSLRLLPFLTNLYLKQIQQDILGDDNTHLYMPLCPVFRIPSQQYFYRNYAQFTVAGQQNMHACGIDLLTDPTKFDDVRNQLNLHIMLYPYKHDWVRSE